MSKPIARVTIFVLLSLVLIAATSVSVRGWLGGAEEKTARVQAHVVDGLQTNLNHDRSTSAEVQSLQSQSEAQSFKQSGSGHGCESEAPQPIPQD